MWRILGALGHPERRLPPVIHVAGTNGKGSTIAFMRAILEAAGLRVHVYTSPHLVRFNERFRLGRDGGGALVSDEELAAALAECERANAGAPITVFEIETAAAFLLFARHPADVLLLEVGLGGRLDATNVIERPLASVITPVSLDHVDFLGDTLDKIAAEKAGILKRGVPAVVAAQPREALAVIERQAARLKRAAPDRRRGLDRERRARPAGLSGRRRPARSAGAEAVRPPSVRECRRSRSRRLRASGMKLPPAAFESGIAKADWPARMQRLPQGRLTALAPPGSELWLDGGHNADGGRAIAAALADLEERVSRPLVLIVGMLSTKDSDGVPAEFRRPRAPRRRGADSAPGQERCRRDAVADIARARSAFRRRPASDLEAALAAIAQLRPRPAAAHPDHRLALSRRRSLALNGTPPIERSPYRMKAAAIECDGLRYFSSFIKSAFFCLTCSIVHCRGALSGRQRSSWCRGGSGRR